MCARAKKTLSAVAAGFIISFTLPCPVSSESLYGYAQSRTVYIKSEPRNSAAGGFAVRQSTGFLISNDGLILTVRHFVNERLQETLGNKSQLERLVKITGSVGGVGPPLGLELVAPFPDPKLDLVILRVSAQASPAHFEQFSLAEDGFLEAGTYEAFGYSNQNTDPNLQRRLPFNLSAPCNPAHRICSGDKSQKMGNSGSPVLRPIDGAVVGMLITSHRRSDNSDGAVEFIHLPAIAPSIDALIAPQKLIRTGKAVPNALRAESSTALSGTCLSGLPFVLANVARHYQEEAIEWAAQRCRCSVTARVSSSGGTEPSRVVVFASNSRNANCHDADKVKSALEATFVGLSVQIDRTRPSSDPIVIFFD